MPQGTSRIWYLTVILSHNNLFVPHWHYILIYGLPVQKCHFSKWNKIYLNCAFYLANHLSVHTIWQIWIQDPHHNLYHWALPISKIPSTVIWYPFQQDITYRDLFIFHYFRYLNLFQDFMRCYVNVLFYRTCLIIMTILIICSFLL